MVVVAASPSTRRKVKVNADQLFRELHVTDKIQAIIDYVNAHDMKSRRLRLVTEEVAA